MDVGCNDCQNQGKVELKGMGIQPITELTNNQLIHTLRSCLEADRDQIPYVLGPLIRLQTRVAFTPNDIVLRGHTYAACGFCDCSGESLSLRMSQHAVNPF